MSLPDRNAFIGQTILTLITIFTNFSKINLQHYYYRINIFILLSEIIESRMIFAIRLIIFMFLFFSIHLAHGQDTIFTANYKKIIAKVIEINNDDVKYKKFNLPSDRIYKIDKRDVMKVIYANGVIDTISPKLLKQVQKLPVPPPVKKFDPRAADYFRNYVYLTATDLFFGMISGGYERTFKSGKGSMVVPFSFGMVNMGLLPETWENRSSATTFLPGGAYYFRNKIFSTGIEINYYPKKQGTVKYFIGPALEYGKYNYYVYKNNSTLPGYFTIEKLTSQFYTFSFKNGLLIQPSKKFNITTFLGIGFENFNYRKDSYVKNENALTDTKLNYLNFSFGINAGYKF